MDARELANLPFERLLEEVQKDPDGVKESVPENMQRLFAARVLSTLAANGKADPSLRNILGTKPSAEYFREVWDLLMKCLSGSPMLEAPARLPPASVPEEVPAVPPVASASPAIPASPGGEGTPTRRRRAAAPVQPEATSPSVPALEVLTEEVRAFSQATTKQAASMADLQEKVAILTTEIRRLESVLERLVDTTQQSLTSLEQQVKLGSRITLAASEMTGNARPQEILESAGLPYIQEALNQLEQ